FAFTSIDPCSFSVAFASPGSRPFEVAQTDVQDVAMPEVFLISLSSSSQAARVFKLSSRLTLLKLLSSWSKFIVTFLPSWLWSSMSQALNLKTGFKSFIALSPTRNTPLSPWLIASPSSQSAPPTAAPIMQDLPVPELPFHTRATVTFTLCAYISPSALLRLPLPSNTMSAPLANSTPSSVLDQATGGCCYALVARMVVVH
ncbi:hypothetical protein B0H13DRAFT_2502446, partial [Mycena leptocephala]